MLLLFAAAKQSMPLPFVHHLERTLRWPQKLLPPALLACPQLTPTDYGAGVAPNVAVAAGAGAVPARRAFTDSSLGTSFSAFL
jgi:hypothetical protein